MRRLKNIFMNSKIKKQVIMLFLPIVILAISVIAIILYVYSSLAIKKNASYVFDNTTKQTAHRIDDKFEFIFNQCNNLKNSTFVWRLVNNTYKKEKSQQEYKDILELYKSMQFIYVNSSNTIDSIAFKTRAGNQLTLYNDMVYDEVCINIEDYEEQEVNANFGYSWLNSHQDTVFPTKLHRDVMSLIFKFKNTEQEDQGIVIFNFKSKYFRQLLDTSQISPNGYMLLVSNDGVLMPSDISEKMQLDESQVEELRQYLGKQGYLEVKNSKTREGFSLYYSPLSVNNWLLVSVVPNSDLFSELSGFKVIFLTVISNAVLISIAISLLSAKIISKPIETLSQKVIAYEKNQNENFYVEAGQEIKTLASGLNHLKMTVYKLLNQVKEEQKQKSKLELLIMQNQIKPHFLYNTLSSIKHLVEMEDKERAMKMCLSLIQFYKIGLSKGKELITIKEEFEHVKNYMDIQQLRYEQVFEYSIEIEQSIEATKIPKMTLQPLVENAIYHGMKLRESTGIIVLTAQSIEDGVRVTLYDDGVGMTVEELKNLQRGIETKEIGDYEGSFGIRNVVKRLQLYFGTNMRYKIESCKEMYTQITLEFPKQPGGR